MIGFLISRCTANDFSRLFRQPWWLASAACRSQNCIGTSSAPSETADADSFQSVTLSTLCVRREGKISASGLPLPNWSIIKLGNSSSTASASRPNHLRKTGYLEFPQSFSTSIIGWNSSVWDQVEMNPLSVCDGWLLGRRSVDVSVSELVAR